MQLLEQLLNLNNSIQDFKLSQHALPYDSSDESDNADILHYYGKLRNCRFRLSSHLVPEHKCSISP